MGGRVPLYYRCYRLGRDELVAFVPGQVIIAAVDMEYLANMRAARPTCCQSFPIQRHASIEHHKSLQSLLYLTKQSNS